MAPPHNPNNWHWVDKSVKHWTKDWFGQTLPQIEAEDGDTRVNITKVVRMTDDDDHDVLIMQHKTKAVAVFDIGLTLAFSAATSDDDDITGEITVADFDHDTKENGFEFGIIVNSKSEENRNRIKDLIRNKIEPQLRQQFLNLIPTLFAVHLESIQHTAPAEKAATPSNETATASEKGAETPVEAEGAAPRKNGTVVNHTALSDEEEFRTTALELFKTFTEEDRLAAFTRARPKRFDGAKVGAQFELFDGNVAGEYLELDEPTKIVQSWRLKQWPEGHYSRQTIQFIQNDDDGVTVMRVTWTGVPLGQEETIKENWNDYYVRSIKRTFGFGTIL